MADHEKDLFSSVPSSRRSFIKKMVAFAFAGPVISSFSLDALASASPLHQPTMHHPNQPPDHDHDHDGTQPDPDDPRHHPPHH
jgi:hypothetical protein